ncbi:MAG: hypothetical protein ACOYLE_02800 [Bacteroidales bacterium]
MEKRKKTGGRIKGVSVNKVSKELKEIIKDVLQNEFDVISETLQKLEPDKRLEIVVKLLPYAIPKLQYIRQEVEPKDNEKTIHIYIDSEEMDMSTD